MPTDVSLTRAVRTTLRTSGVWLVVLIGAAVQFVPWVSVLLPAGYFLTLQRRVRNGEEGLPPLSGFVEWMRRGIGAIALALPPVMVWLVPAVPVLLIMDFVLHIKLSTPLGQTILLLLLLPLLPVTIAVSIRYAAFDRIREASAYRDAVRRLFANAEQAGMVLVWQIAVVIVPALVRQVMAMLLGVRFVASTLLAAAVARPSATTLGDVAAYFALSVLTTGAGLVSAHLLGQLSTIVYPPDEMAAVAQLHAEGNIPPAEEPAEEIWG